MLPRLFYFLMLPLPLLLLPACSVGKRVEAARARVLHRYQRLPEMESLPQRVITWDAAVEMMLQHNVDYAAGLHALELARQQERAVFRNMIPSLHLGYYYNRALFHSPAYQQAGTGQLDANILFNMPELLHLPVDKYARALAVFKAELDCKLKRRELEAKLYTLITDIMRCRGLREADESARLADAATRQARLAEERLQEREQWLTLCELLGNYEARWQILPESLPRVRLSDYRARAKEPGELTQIMLALELEASRLRRLGVALRYWPNTQVNFYSPTLFNMSGGNMGGFTNGAKDVRISLNLFLQVDTRLEIWQDAQNAAAEHHLLTRQLEQKLISWREKMRRIVESWDQYEQWRLAMDEYVRFRRSQGAQDADGLLQLHDDSLKLRRELREQESKNAERIGALIQEYGFLSP